MHMIGGVHLLNQILNSVDIASWIERASQD